MLGFKDTGAADGTQSISNASTCTPSSDTTEDSKNGVSWDSKLTCAAAERSSRSYTSMGFSASLEDGGELECRAIPHKEQWLALRVHGGSRNWPKLSSCFNNVNAWRCLARSCFSYFETPCVLRKLWLDESLQFYQCAVFVDSVICLFISCVCNYSRFQLDWMIWDLVLGPWKLFCLKCRESWDRVIASSLNPNIRLLDFITSVLLSIIVHGMLMQLIYYAAL